MKKSKKIQITRYSELGNKYPVKKVTSQLTDLEIVTDRLEISATIKELEILKARIDEVLYRRADKQPEKRYAVGDNTVMIIARPNFNKVSLAFCKRYDAIKEVPDADILKPLYDKGIKIPNIIVTSYPTVK